MCMRFAHEKLMIPYELWDQFLEQMTERWNEWRNGGAEEDKEEHEGSRKAGGAVSHQIADVEAAAGLSVSNNSAAGEKRRNAAKELAAREDVEDMLAERRYQRRKAVLLTGVAWGVLAWFVFVCARTGRPPNPLQSRCWSWLLRSTRDVLPGRKKSNHSLSPRLNPRGASLSLRRRPPYLQPARRGRPGLVRGELGHRARHRQCQRLQRRGDRGVEGGVPYDVAGALRHPEGNVVRATRRQPICSGAGRKCRAPGCCVFSPKVR